MSMQVAILGAGGVACAMAALLVSHGHQPVLWSPSGKGTRDLRGADLVASGALDLRFRPQLADDVAGAVRGARAVVLALPANGHRRVIDALMPHVQDGQTIIVSAQLSLGALYLFRAVQAQGTAATVIAWGTTVVMGRRSGPAQVQIGGIRERVETAVLPPDQAGDGLARCRTLFGDRFLPAPSLIAVALGNLNPPVHMANALCNLTRIEKAEAWANYDGITPAVARLIEGLDAERLALAAEFGVPVRSVQTHFRQSFGLPDGLSLAQMAALVHQRRNGPPGPTDLSTRFVTEDLPFGIVQIIALAASRRMDVPLHQAGLRIFDALYGCDFTALNDLLPRLDLNDPLLTAASPPVGQAGP
jgi:opine dehydrogenase